MSTPSRKRFGNTNTNIWDVTESIDYTPFNNAVELRRRESLLNSQYNFDTQYYEDDGVHPSDTAQVRWYGVSGRTFFSLMATLVTGMLIGMTGKILELSIDVGIRARNDVLMQLMLHTNPETGVEEEGSSMYSASVFVLGSSLALVAVSASTVQWFAPGAAGSGVSLVMALLNGNDIAGLLTPMVFLVKLVGTVMTRLACLPLGPEAPLVHLGTCVAWMVFHTGQRIVGWNLLREQKELLRRTRDAIFSNASLRQLISAGAAAGMAAAFGAPVGGVLFALEEACSVWSKKTAWRCLLAAAIAVFTMAQVLPSFGGGYILSFSGIYPLSDRQWLLQLPFVIFMSLVSGLLGAVFNLMRRWVQNHRVSKRKHALRVIEACVVALLSASTFLSAPKLFGRCLDLPPTWEPRQVLQYSCPAGQYNDLATALFSPAPGVIRSFLGLGSESEPINRICTFSMPCYYSLTALFTVGMVYFGLMVLSSGLAVPGGLFMPTVMIGGSLGAFFGIILNPLVPPSWDIQPGVYAIVGAAAMLAAVFRSSVSLVVILVEGTRGINFLPGILVAVIISNFIAHWIHPDGVYESELEVDGRVFFLRQEPPGRLRNKTAQDLMASPVIGIREVETVARVLHVLSSTTHNGFPVYERNSSNQLVGFILRSQLLILLGEKSYCDENGMYLRQPNNLSVENYEIRMDALMHHAVHGGSEIVNALVSSDDESENSQEDGVDRVMSNAFKIMNNVSGHPSFADLLSEQDEVSASMEAFVNVAPFMDLGPITVRPATPAAHCHQMFVTMSLRHVCVTNTMNNVVGIITRKDLDRAAGHGWWRSNKIAPEPSRNEAVMRSTSWFASAFKEITVPKARRMLSDLINSFSPHQSSHLRSLLSDENESPGETP